MTSRLAKDIQYLCRHVDRLSNGQARVTEVDDSLYYLKLDILPNDGYYRGAKIRFKLQFDINGYPVTVPQVTCLDYIYHPNIDAVDTRLDFDVCVSLLDEWEPSMSLDHIVMAILFLMYHPNPEDALSPLFDGCSLGSDFEDNVRHTLKGGSLEGVSFPCLLVCRDENANDSTDSIKMNTLNTGADCDSVLQVTVHSVDDMTSQVFSVQQNITQSFQELNNNDVTQNPVLALVTGDHDFRTGELLKSNSVLKALQTADFFNHDPSLFSNNNTSVSSSSAIVMDRNIFKCYLGALGTGISCIKTLFSGFRENNFQIGNTTSTVNDDMNGDSELD